MPVTLFTSNRERRLWLCALAVVVAIYSTLGLAGTLAEVLRERNLLPASLLFLLFLLVAAIVGSGLKRRPGRREVWVALGITAVYGLAVLRMSGSPEERTHLFEYGIVAVLIYHALSERSQNGRWVRAPAALALVVTALLGWLDEGIQALLPNRVYDIFDVFVNALSALMAIAASLAIAWARRRIGARPGSRCRPTSLRTAPQPSKSDHARATRPPPSPVASRPPYSPRVRRSPRTPRARRDQRRPAWRSRSDSFPDSGHPWRAHRSGRH